MAAPADSCESVSLRGVIGKSKQRDPASSSFWREFCRLAYVDLATYANASDPTQVQAETNRRKQTDSRIKIQSSEYPKYFSKNPRRCHRASPASTTVGAEWEWLASRSINRHYGRRCREPPEKKEPARCPAASNGQIARRSILISRRSRFNGTKLIRLINKPRARSVLGAANASASALFPARRSRAGRARTPRFKGSPKSAKFS